MPNDGKYRNWTPAERKERGLKKLAVFMRELRRIDALDEKSPGIFRWKGRVFLHFHHLRDGIFVADARIDGDDLRKFHVTTPAEQAKFLATLRKAIGE